MHAALREAVRAGLAVHLGSANKFLRGRIQQATYSLIPPERRADMHSSRGRRLLANMTAEQLAERAFEVVVRQIYIRLQKWAALNREGERQVRRRGLS